jgi:hypothetical protein
MTQNDFTTISLTLTINHNGQIVIIPITAWLFAMWLLTTLPLIAYQTANAMTYSALTFLSATLVTIIIGQIFFKALIQGVTRS